MGNEPESQRRRQRQFRALRSRPWILLSARQSDLPDKNYSARVPLEVGSSNLNNVNVTLASGMTLAGSIVIDGESTVPLSEMRPRLELREFGPMISNFTPIKVDADGSFRIDNVFPESYTVFVFMPDGFYLKAIRLGQKQLPPPALDLTSGAAEPLAMVVSPKAARVSGTVQDPQTSQGAAGATVVLIPEEPERRSEFSFYKQTSTDQSRAFTFRNLPPGSYKVFAWEDVENGAYMDPDYLKPCEGSGEKIEVREGGQYTVQVSLIPADTPAAAGPGPAAK